MKKSASVQEYKVDINANISRPCVHVKKSTVYMLTRFTHGSIEDYFCGIYCCCIDCYKSFVFGENSVFPRQCSEAVNAALDSFNRKPRSTVIYLPPLCAGAVFKVNSHRGVFS